MFQRVFGLKVRRAELKKPEQEQFQPDPNAIMTAVREQWGIKLVMKRRTLPVLIVEKE